MTNSGGIESGIDGLAAAACDYKQARTPAAKQLQKFARSGHELQLAGQHRRAIPLLLPGNQRV
jgi:hypothetical protein